MARLHTLYQCFLLYFASVSLDGTTALKNIYLLCVCVEERGTRHVHHSAHVDVKGSPAGVLSLLQSVGPRIKQTVSLSAKHTF